MEILEEVGGIWELRGFVGIGLEIRLGFERGIDC